MIGPELQLLRQSLIHPPSKYELKILVMLARADPQPDNRLTNWCQKMKEKLSTEVDNFNNTIRECNLLLTYAYLVHSDSQTEDIIDSLLLPLANA